MATTNDLKLIQRDTVDIVSEKVREFQENGELCLPLNYSPENAMKAAWLTLQEIKDKDNKPALEVCSKNSIANALLNMVVQGLNPAKKQCYFIPYGNSLTLMRSYFGSIHVAKMVDPDIDDIYAEVVYEGDIFTYAKKRGLTFITAHEQKLENIDKAKIKAAYAAVLYKDGTENTAIMTFEEIKQAWSQSKVYPVTGNGDLKPGTTHDKFTAEMAKKTVINRLCKLIINTSDDSSIIIKAYKRTAADIAEAEAKEEIDANANTIFIDPADVDVATGELAETQPEAIAEKPTTKRTKSAISEPVPETPTVDAKEDDLP